MANRLSDDELRRTLLEYGEDVGPITPTTRSLWERRLTNLRKRSNGPTLPKQSSLNAFSSDDSELENAGTPKVRKKKTFNRNESTERLGGLNLGLNSSPDSDIFKKPSPVNTPIPRQGLKHYNYRNLPTGSQHTKVTTRKSSSKLSTFDVETSDSDFDSESSVQEKFRLRRKSAIPSTPSPPASDLLGAGLKKSSDSIASYETPSLHRRSLGSTWSVDTKPVYRFSPVQSKLKPDISEHAFRTNGFLTNTMSNGEFHEQKLQGSSTNYSHCVSWMLVVGAITFFAIIGTLYMTEVQKSSQSASKNYSKYCGNLDEETCKRIMDTSRDLHKLLTAVAGEYECESGSAKSRNLTVSEARTTLFEQFPDEDIEEKEFKSIFYQSLMLIVEHPEEFKIRVYSPSESPTVLASKSDLSAVKREYLDSSALEATQAAKSWWCRVKFSLQWTTSRLLMLCAFILILCLAYVCFCLWKKRREAQEKLFYEMVENVIDILQEPQDSSSYQSDANLGPYKAVVNIRDTLITPKERKQKLWLWDKVVAFIEENESRVTVDYRKINGEDFKVWRWQPTTGTEGEGGKQGKVWQGQAFNSLNKGKSSWSPTPCLKIRNMFDTEVEYGDDWQVSIQDAILEKCEGNDGVRHIAVDTSSTEGCVYMLCSSSEAAGKAFNALHGWWFDGKLVTVKYIRYKRYVERFPEAEHCTEPLKPSNNMRRSLSTPFFSSALERS